MQNLLNKLKSITDTAKTNMTYNNIKIIEGINKAEVEVGGKKYLNMCSNNYLGFAGDVDSINSSINAIKKYGIASGAVRSISGTQLIHQECENIIAKFKKVEDVIIFQSGFQANTGLIPAIISKNDVVISDSLNHASIIDGIRLIGLPREHKFIYDHKNMTILNDKLILASEVVKKTKGIIFIITDGVFSMDGDYAPLDEISSLCDKYNAIPIVDDAHGEGVFGSHGRGLVDHFGLQGKYIEVGTLSKAIGSAGGFVGGPKILIDFLKQKSRPFLFSTGIDVSLMGAVINNINVLIKDDSRIKKLWSNADYLKDQLHKAGISTGKSQSPITPVIVGEEWKATKLTKLMFADGILVSPIIFPTVPLGKGRIRLMPSSLHTIAQIDRTVASIIKHIKNF